MLNFKAKLIATGAAMALITCLAPAVSTAQPYDRYDDGYSQDQSDYDACRHQQSNNAVAGALIGGAIGAAIGAGAGHGHHGTGALVGAGVGGTTGALVGNSTVDCNHPPPPPPPPTAYDNRYDGGDRYGDRYDNGPPPYAGDGRYDDRYDDRDNNGYAEGDSDDADQGYDCRNFQHDYYGSDGRSYHRSVRECRDSSGRYVPVD